MDSPTWRKIEGQGGSVTYDNTWLHAHAVEWHLSSDGSKNITLHYLASEPMPLTHATLQTVTGNPPLTQEQEGMTLYPSPELTNSTMTIHATPLTQAQEDMVRRIVVEEIARAEKRLVSLTVYELGQRTASMKQVRGEKQSKGEGNI